LPSEERRKELSLMEIYGFLDQSNITKKNIKRLAQFEAESIAQVAELASLVKRIAFVKPGRRRRWKWLWQNRPELVRAAAEADLIDFISLEDLEMSDDGAMSLANDILADLGRLSYGFNCKSDSWNDDPEPRYDTTGRDGETITAIENVSSHRQ